MKTLHRADRTSYYITDENFNVIAHTSPDARQALLSLANIEGKVRDYLGTIIENNNPYERGSAEDYVWVEGACWALKNFKIEPPDTFEVDVEMAAEILMVTKIIKSL